MNKQACPQAAGKDLSALLNEQQAAQFLNVSLSTLRQRRFKGLPPEFIKIGKSVRYSQDALATFVSERTRRCAK